MFSSLAGEFWFWATTVHVPTRQASNAAAGVALGDAVALGEDPPHAASATPADATKTVTSLETIADRASIRCFIANTLPLGCPPGARRAPLRNLLTLYRHVPSRGRTAIRP